jgi:hypothetical protein
VEKIKTNIVIKRKIYLIPSEFYYFVPATTDSDPDMKAVR